MAASSLLLLRISEFLRTRKSAIATDAAAGCRDEDRARKTEDGAAMFPWAEKLQGMVQGTADALLARTAQGEAPGRKPTAAQGEAGDIQLLLSDAWLVRNSFLRALNRFQGEQSGKKVDFTAMEMTEARQEALQEFDRQISAALSSWITGSSHTRSVPTESVRDLLHGLRAIQGLLQMASDTIPAGSKAHVSAAVQQLARLTSSTQELVDGEPQPEQTRTGMAMASPHAAAPRAAVQLVLAPLDVPSFVRALGESSRPAALKRGLRIECLCNPGPQILHTDAAKLHRAATLLIDYAISLTEEGQVSIVSDRDESGAWNLEIRDSSPGIPPAILAKLLRGVSHAPENAAGLHDSTLNIALACDLVELLGGQVEATSDPGEGNCFVIALPAGEASGKK